MSPKKVLHGGRRAGAGRKRVAPRPLVEHRTRPLHASRYPSHVTVKFAKRVANLRTQRMFNALRAIFLKAKRGASPRAFHVVEYSVQRDHVHLVVESANRDAFIAGMRSLTIRAALAVNRIIGRKRGQVIRDRYHRRDLFSARAVRTALRYVLLNGVKHGQGHVFDLDQFSSALAFNGWKRSDLLDTSTGPPQRNLVTVAARVEPWTQLLSSDWRRHGLISPFEADVWRVDLWA